MKTRVVLDPVAGYFNYEVPYTKRFDQPLNGMYIQELNGIDFPRFRHADLRLKPGMERRDIIGPQQLKAADESFMRHAEQKSKVAVRPRPALPPKLKSPAQKTIPAKRQPVRPTQALKVTPVKRSSPARVHQNPKQALVTPAQQAFKSSVEPAEPAIQVPAVVNTAIESPAIEPAKPGKGSDKKSGGTRAIVWGAVGLGAVIAAYHLSQTNNTKPTQSKQTTGKSRKPSPGKVVTGSI